MDCIAQPALVSLFPVMVSLGNLMSGCLNKLESHLLNFRALTVLFECVFFLKTLNPPQGNLLSVVVFITSFSLYVDRRSKGALIFVLRNSQPRPSRNFQKCPSLQEIYQRFNCQYQIIFQLEWFSDFTKNLCCQQKIPKNSLQQNFSPSDKQAELPSDSFSCRNFSQWHVAEPKCYF